MFKKTKLSYIILFIATLFCVLFGACITAEAADQMSVTIGENIVSNYNIDTAAHKTNGAIRMTYTYNASEEEDFEKVTEEVALTSTNNNITFSIAQAAPQIKEETVIKFYRTNDTSDVEATIVFSPYDYCNTIINKTDAQITADTGTNKPQKLRMLCKNIIAYGKASQGIFTEYMAKEGAQEITDDYSSDLGISGATYALGAKKRNGTNITFKTASFFCTSSSKMRFYLEVNNGFDLSTTSPSNVVLPDGATYEQVIDPETGAKYVEVDGIKPVDYDKQIDITYPDNARIAMSVLDYAALVLNNSYPEETKTLARTLIIYNQKAQKYFNGVAPTFSYISTWSNSAKTVKAGNNNYIMPDISGTNSNFGSTTVNGTTIYYPIVSVKGTAQDNTSYSSGNIYYYANAFGAINIYDYNQDTDANNYSYKSNSTAWPRNNASGPDSNCLSFSEGVPFYTNDSSKNNYIVNSALVFASGPYTSNCDNEPKNLVKFKYTGLDGNEYFYYIRFDFSRTTYSSGGGTTPCVAEDTLITMADGSKKPVQDIQYGDMVMTWSLWNGCYEAQPVITIWNHGRGNYEILKLIFSDGTEVKTLVQHGFFDVDKNIYVYITTDNITEFVGDRFVKQASDGTNTEVTLTDYEIYSEYTGSYSFFTAYNLGYIANDMLAMNAELDCPGLYEFFEMGDGMKYDEEKMNADIEKYGLYSYDDLSAYLTEEQFEMLNGKYCKVNVEKGLYTEEDLIKLIQIYVQGQ